jgi:hypothetical protein
LCEKSGVRTCVVAAHDPQFFDGVGEAVVEAQGEGQVGEGPHADQGDLVGVVQHQIGHPHRRRFLPDDGQVGGGVVAQPPEPVGPVVQPDLVGGGDEWSGGPSVYRYLQGAVSRVRPCLDTYVSPADQFEESHHVDADVVDGGVAHRAHHRLDLHLAQPVGLEEHQHGHVVVGADVHIEDHSRRRHLCPEVEVLCYQRYRSVLKTWRAPHVRLSRSVIGPSVLIRSARWVRAVSTNSNEMSTIKIVNNNAQI